MASTAFASFSKEISGVFLKPLGRSLYLAILVITGVIDLSSPQCAWMTQIHTQLVPMCYLSQLNLISIKTSRGKSHLQIEIQSDQWWNLLVPTHFCDYLELQTLWEAFVSGFMLLLEKVQSRGEN